MSKPINPRPRRCSPKPIPKIDVSLDQVSRAIFLSSNAARSYDPRAEDPHAEAEGKWLAETEAMTAEDCKLEITLRMFVTLVFVLACMAAALALKTPFLPGEASAAEEERYEVAQVTAERFPNWDRLYRPWWDGMTDQGRHEIFTFCAWYGDARSDTQASYFGGSFEKTLRASLSCLWVDHNKSWLVGEQPDLLGN